MSKFEGLWLKLREQDRNRAVIELYGWLRLDPQHLVDLQASGGSYVLIFRDVDRFGSDAIHTSTPKYRGGTLFTKEILPIDLSEVIQNLDLKRGDDLNEGNIDLKCNLLLVVGDATAGDPANFPKVALGDTAHEIKVPQDVG